LRPSEITLGQAGDCQRAEEWRRQIDAELRGELERAPVHLGKTGRGKPFRHTEHRRQVGEESHLPVPALIRLRQCADEVERAIKEAGHLSASVNLLGGFRRPAIPMNCPVKLTGALPMDRNLAADGIEIACMQVFQRLRDGGVVAPPPGGAEGEVGNLADLVVAEVVGVGAPLAHDTAAPEFVQSANQRLFAGVARIREDSRRELSADRRGEADQIPRWLGQLRQAIFNNGLHLRADPLLFALAAPPGA
jgi:hypothetical protein